MSLYSMCYTMLSHIPQLEQTNIQTFLYNNLTIHPIWICCIYSMSLSHPFKLVSSGFEQKILKYRQRDDKQKLANSLSYALLTFLDIYNTCFFLPIYSSICDLRSGDRICTF